MTQDGVVTRNISNSMAEVAVTRVTACGGNCGSCEACVFQSEMKVAAINDVRAKPGQRVVIESKSSKVYKAIVLVYIMPLMLFLAGYIIASVIGAGEGMCIVSSFAGLGIGAALIVLSQKRKNRSAITYRIIKVQ